MSDPRLLFELNRRTIDMRFSKEYIVGSRVLMYMNLLKHGRIKALIQRVNKDHKTLKLRRNGEAAAENVLTVDFQKPYSGDRLAVYTSIYGKYDQLCEPLYVDPNCDYYILTDQEVPKQSVWKKVKVDFPEEVNTDFLKNRYVKMFPHKLFKDYRYSLYVDGNITLVSAVSLYLNAFNCPAGIAMHKHPASDDLYDEIEACLMTRKINCEEAKSLRKKLSDEGFPRHFGVFECNIILRDHNSDMCKALMVSWWNELMHGVKRDQLHFTYALFRAGYQYSDIALLGSNMNKNPMFIRASHN